MEVKASRTSSSLKGLIMAMTIFMEFDPRLSPFYVHAVRAVSLSRAPEACFAGMAGQIESNAVPNGLKRPIQLIQMVKFCRPVADPNTGQGDCPTARHGSKGLLKK